MMEMYDKPQPLERYLDRELKCRCGRLIMCPSKLWKSAAPRRRF